MTKALDRRRTCASGRHSRICDFEVTGFFLRKNAHCGLVVSDFCKSAEVCLEENDSFHTVQDQSCPVNDVYARGSGGLVESAEGRVNKLL